MEDSLILRGKERQRKTLGATIKRDLNSYGLSLNMIHDRVI